MEHGLTLITTLTAAFGFALLFGFIAERLKVPSLVGYLLSGIIISPATPGFVADVNIASQLSEIGIMLLMFGVGLHFSLADILRVKYVAVTGAIGQMTIATLVTMVVSHFWGYSWGEALVFGVCLSCASTVVLLKALEAQGLLKSLDGQITIGWLVVEDLMTVLILVLLPPLTSVLLGNSTEATGTTDSLWYIIAMTLLRVIAFIALMLIIGKRILPWLLWQVAKLGSRELFTLSVLTIAIGIAYGAAELFGVSFALGAFFSGMVMRESKYAHRAAIESLPLRDAFSVIFFVGVGMMFDPMILAKQPLEVLAVVFIILAVKSIVAFGFVLLFKYPLHSAITVGVAVSQIGEFSFILSSLAISLGIMQKEGLSLVLAGAIFSIALNPLLFALIPWIRSYLKKYWKFARIMDARKDPLSLMPDDISSELLRGHVVIVGANRVGRQIGEDVRSRNISVVVIDKDREKIEKLREDGYKAIFGDATIPEILIQAHIQDSSLVVITIRNDVEARKIIDVAKQLNPNIEVVLKAETEEIARQATLDNIGKIFEPEILLAKEVTRYVLGRFGRKTNTDDDNAPNGEHS